MGHAPVAQSASVQSITTAGLVWFRAASEPAQGSLRLPGGPVRHLFRKRYRPRPMNHEGGRLNEGAKLDAAGEHRDIPFAKGEKAESREWRFLLGTGVLFLLLDCGLDLFPHAI